MATHYTKKRLQTHTLKPAESQTAGATTTAQAVPGLSFMCKAHPDKPLELYCSTCAMLVCLKCALLHHKGDEHNLGTTMTSFLPHSWAKQLFILKIRDFCDGSAYCLGVQGPLKLLVSFLKRKVVGPLYDRVSVSSRGYPVLVLFFFFFFFLTPMHRFFKRGVC